MAKKAKYNFYAVKAGRVPGIYRTWDECKAQTDGYSGAVYKGFYTQADAQNFLEAPESTPNQNTAGQPLQLPDGPYAFVDGSYNPNTCVYGYGGFLVDGENRYPLQGSGADNSGIRNINGEIHGSMAAVQKARELGLTHITMFFDYLGIREWATGAWNATTPDTQAYRDFMRTCGVEVVFEKVAAHTGIPGNEQADQMAKEACGAM